MDAVQLNVRLPRALKEQGDATLAMVGSSPTRIIRGLWSKLAQGGDAYRQIALVLADHPERGEHAEDISPIDRSTHLFESLGTSLGLDISSFEPSDSDPYELIEDDDWGVLVERGLA